jgi:hypothetical protein
MGYYTNGFNGDQERPIYEALLEGNGLNRFWAPYGVTGSGSSWGVGKQITPPVEGGGAFKQLIKPLSTILQPNDSQNVEEASDRFIITIPTGDTVTLNGIHILDENNVELYTISITPAVYNYNGEFTINQYANFRLLSAKTYYQQPAVA